MPDPLGLEKRCEQFALDVIGLIRSLPFDEPGPTIKRQLTRAATGVAANYRASRRSRSHTEFTSRIGVVAEEADESLFWLRLSVNSQLGERDFVQRLVKEADELTAIFSKMWGTARKNERLAKSRSR